MDWIKSSKKKKAGLKASLQGPAGKPESKKQRPS